MFGKFRKPLNAVRKACAGPIGDKMAVRGAFPCQFSHKTDLREIFAGLSWGEINVRRVCAEPIRGEIDVLRVCAEPIRGEIDVRRAFAGVS